MSVKVSSRKVLSAFTARGLGPRGESIPGPCRRSCGVEKTVEGPSSHQVEKVRLREGMYVTCLLPPRLPRKQMVTLEFWCQLCDLDSARTSYVSLGHAFSASVSSSVKGG